MSIPTYPEYTDSGFQWLGAVPSSWSSVPFGMLFRRIKRTDHGDEELLSVYRDYGVIRKSDRDDNFNNASDDLSSYQLVEPGDLAMNKMKAWQGSLGVSDLRGIVSPAYFVFSPRKQYHPPFMHYLLRSPPYAAGYMTISKGIRINQWDVDPDHLTSLPVLLPSIVEQEAIAAFLNRETAKIDALVAQQERLIELLKEKRQAVISHAITKGLDPDAPMKDSCVEWLGEIPAHWEVRRLRFVADIETGDADTAHAVEEGEYPFFVRSPNIERINRNTHDCEAVMTAGDGAGVGKVFHHFTGKFCAHQRVYIFTNFRGVSGMWFYEYLKALFYRVVLEGTAKSTVDSLRRPMIADFPVTIPAPDEIAPIEAHIAEECRQFDELMAEAEKAVELLKERRAALISAAVTGKIDVRGLTEKHKMEAA